MRKSSQVFGRGTLTFIRPANRTVLAYVRQLGDEAILCVANLSRSAQAVELDLSAWKGRVPQEMLGRTRFPRIGELPYLVTLPPYGFFWFQLTADAQTEPEKVLPREVTTLVLGDGWENALSSWTRRTFEADVLPQLPAGPALVCRQGHAARSRRRCPPPSRSSTAASVSRCWSPTSAARMARAAISCR